MIPEVRAVNSQLHLIYNLPGRVHTIEPYPLPAPNGSTILLLGHENGLRILWYGGRALKPQPEGHQQNGNHNHGQSIALDSDEEADDGDIHLESDEEDYDPSKPFERILQSLDLPFGVAVLHIAFPSYPTEPLQRRHAALPALFSEKLVAAITCSDASVKLVTLPVAPSHPLRRRKSAAKNTPDRPVGPYGEEITTVTGGTDHQAVPKSVSLTLAPSTFIEEDSDLDMKEDGTRHTRSASKERGRQRSQTRSRSSSLRGAEGWDILVASSSSDLSGLVLIHRIPLTGEGTQVDLTTRHTIPWRIQHLPSPAASIQFNPSLPQEKRNAMLLIAEAKGPVRILDCLATETAGHCTWLVTLLPGFQSMARGRALRKHVLDAKWVQNGRAVVVLLADGEWGIWDIFDAQPKALSGDHARQASRLGNFSTFAISGSINASPHLSNADSQKLKTRDGGKAGRLAPMTPGTRRIRQENLFSGPIQQAEGPARGGICIISSQDAKATDDAISLWHNDNITVIPSLRTHWANKVKGTGNLFGNGAKGEARAISNISLLGERRSDVVLLPVGPQFRPERSSSTESVLVLGETRFVVVTAPLGEPQATTRNPLQPPTDQKLLERGDLTLEGMDRVLASMDNSRTAPNKLAATNGVSSASAKRKVNFLDM
ncbi:MAG: hypothetical protein LQ339_000569 [Xanthoria mediterranea]|nr:MAG: hypothetical protein LQ339_000569 [Xanthoria mediterranea]